MLGLAVRTSISLLLLATTGCFTDEPSAQTDDDPTGGDCPAGSAACACYGNGTCDAGLTCYEPGVCANSSCVAGQDQCPCDEATCAPGLTCQGDFCSAPAASTGGEPSTTAATSPDGSGTDAGTQGSSDTIDATTAVSSDGVSGPTQLVLYMTPYNDGAFINFSELTAATARSATTEYCESAASVNLGQLCNTAIALVSVDRLDSVSTFGSRNGVPVTVPVVAASGAPIADSFEALRKNGPTPSLQDAGVVPAGEELPVGLIFFHTATTNAGLFDGSCGDWTGGTVVGGTFLSTAGPGWLSGETGTCNTASELLCACWNTD